MSLTIFPLLASAAFFQSRLNAIYNIDNRELISQDSDTQVKTLSRSVALIFNKDDLITEYGQQLIFANRLDEIPPVGQNVCSDELFATHHAYRNGCTGFLVGDDLLATAGHCFRDFYSCYNQVIAFDVDTDSEIPRGFKAQNQNVYTCKEVLSPIYDNKTKQDYAVIRLDRKTNRTPLKIRSRGKISSKDNLFMIGHPLGLPLTYSPNGKISENNDELFFKTKINSFHGNSGSPVFNAKTFEVEGILVRGEVDLKTDDKNHCQRYVKYSSSNKEDNLKGEGVTRIRSIIPFLYSTKFDFFK